MSLEQIPLHPCACLPSFSLYSIYHLSRSHEPNLIIRLAPFGSPLTTYPYQKNPQLLPGDSETMQIRTPISSCRPCQALSSTVCEGDRSLPVELPGSSVLRRPCSSFCSFHEFNGPRLYRSFIRRRKPGPLRDSVLNGAGAWRIDPSNPDSIVSHSFVLVSTPPLDR